MFLINLSNQDLSKLVNNIQQSMSDKKTDKCILNVS